MIALAAVASWAVYGVAFELVGGGWALLAASIALFAPFFVHELYFTWPKLAAAAGVLVSFLLVRRSRALAAGVFLGVAYLFHPSAILAAPFLAACVLADRSSAWQRPGFRWAAAYAAGLLVVVLAWQSVRLLSPVKQLGQEGFLDYFRLADNRLATPDTWLRTRWDNLTNTFVPFRLLFTDQTHESINSYYGPSDGWVHFGFLYWNTLPFALGLGAFFVLAPALALGIWRRPAAAGVFVLGPAALLVVYWGCACTGLMRHTGHWFFFSTILFSVWSLRQCGGRLRSWPVAIMTHPAWIAARGLDVGWMAFGTALHGHWPRPGSPFFANDWIALGLAATLLSAAAALLASALAPVGRAILERAPAGAAAPVT
jgi:hypothetical protein